MDLRQYLLGKLAEEASEIAQIALKTQQFGFGEKCPEQNFTNVERIHQEIDDLKTIITMLNELGFAYTPNYINRGIKRNKVIRYLKYSVGLGKVEHQALKEYEND